MHPGHTQRKFVIFRERAQAMQRGDDRDFVAFSKHTDFGACLGHHHTVADHQDGLFALEHQR